MNNKYKINNNKNKKIIIDKIKYKYEEIEENNKKLEEYNKIIEDNKKLLENKDKIIEDKQKEIEDNKKLLKEYKDKINNYILNIKDNNNKIKIIYHNKKNEKEISIFGDNFVKNNKDKCKIFYNNKEYDLITKFNVENINQLEIELNGILNINNMSHMFYNCSNLIYVPNIGLINTKNVTDMSDMFSDCNALKNIPNKFKN